MKDKEKRRGKDKWQSKSKGNLLLRSREKILKKLKTSSRGDFNSLGTSSLSSLQEMARTLLTKRSLKS